MFFPENVSKSRIAPITNRSPPISFSYFENNGQKYTKSSLNHEWIRTHYSITNVVFRMTQFSRSFCLFGETVIFGGII
jgi:hypothetical protein